MKEPGRYRAVLETRACRVRRVRERTRERNDRVTLSLSLSLILPQRVVREIASAMLRL